MTDIIATIFALAAYAGLTRRNLKVDVVDGALHLRLIGKAKGSVSLDAARTWAKRAGLELGSAQGFMSDAELAEAVANMPHYSDYEAYCAAKGILPS